MGEEIDVQGGPDAPTPGSPRPTADQHSARAAERSVVNLAAVPRRAGWRRRRGPSHPVRPVPRRTRWPARRCRPDPPRPAGRGPASRSSITRWCGSKNQLETASISRSSRNARNPLSEPKFAASWVGFSQRLPAAGAGRQFDAFEAGDGHRLQGALVVFPADEIVELGLVLIDRIRPSDGVHVDALPVDVLEDVGRVPARDCCALGVIAAVLVGLVRVPP